MRQDYPFQVHRRGFQPRIFIKNKKYAIKRSLSLGDSITRFECPDFGKQNWPKKWSIQCIVYVKIFVFFANRGGDPRMDPHDREIREMRVLDPNKLKILEAGPKTREMHVLGSQIPENEPGPKNCHFRQ